MNKKYIKNMLKIFKSNDDVLKNKLKKLFKLQKNNLDDILSYIASLFIEFGEEGYIKLSRFKKKRVLNEADKKISKLIDDIGLFEVKVVENTLKDIYKNTYTKINKYLKAGLKLIRQEHIESVVNTSYKGEMYSDRIWKNKKKMIKVLKKELNKAMQGESDINSISSKIKKEFGVQAYESQRLAITEMARVQGTANEDIARELGITEQLFDATLDTKTSAKCRELDGTYWNIDDMNKPIPPLHPNCRSCLINVPYKGWQPTQKWDNENKKVVDYETHTKR